MAAEKKRGCGYRKVGGLYLVSGKLISPCGGLPMPLTVCPCCGEGIKQARGWTWINPQKMFAKGNFTCNMNAAYCSTCPISHPPEKAGLIWTGGRFYKTPHDFMAEAMDMGVSRRVNSIPRGLVIGETQVYVAHPLGYRVDTALVSEDPLVPNILTEYKPAVITCFVPTAIEMLVTETQSRDEEFMADLEKRKITPVVVPDNDPDHQGSVYDKDEPKDELGQLVHNIL